MMSARSLEWLGTTMLLLPGCCDDCFRVWWGWAMFTSSFPRFAADGGLLSFTSCAGDDRVHAVPPGFVDVCPGRTCTNLGDEEYECT